MPSIVIQLDDDTYKKLKDVVTAARGERSRFVREAVRDALRRHEFARIREGYRIKPDSAAEADDWSSAEEFQP